MTDFNEIVLREKERRLNINRVPPKIKKEFVEYADEEFCSDYGACLHAVWNDFKLWKTYFENIDMKIDIIIDKLNVVEEEPEKREGIKMLSGKIIKKEVGK